jgi:transposase-like protein
MAYRKEFRDEAMALVLKHGYKRATAATKLGISQSTLDSWLRKAGCNGPGSIPLSEDPRILQMQVREFQAQIKDLKADLEILKKAIAFFADRNT